MVHSRKKVESNGSESDSHCDTVKNSKRVLRIKIKKHESTLSHKSKTNTQAKTKSLNKEMTSSSSESESDHSSGSDSEDESEENSRESDSSESDSNFSDQVKKPTTKKNNQKRFASRKVVKSDSDESSSSDIKPKKVKQSKAKRKAAFHSSDESDDGNDSSEQEAKPKTKKRKATKKKGLEKRSKPAGRREIRTVLKKGQLTEETKDAEKQERERRKRLEKSKDNKIVEVDVDDSLDHSIPLPITKRLVLQKEPLVEVHPHITLHLKPHQVEGIQFIWDNLVETTAAANKGVEGGCILAHCMGLGKTLQTISVLHTLLTTEHLSFKTALVVAPLNTLLNWINEFNNWVPEDSLLTLYNLNEYQTIRTRLHALKAWHKTGGVMVLGYDMFRLLASGVRIKYKRWKIEFAELLLDPGPDVVVCDEGHKLKNSESNISVVMSKIKTSRRLVLTGTPLQNNLMEYQCMVNFVKPNLLGSVKEFRNRFVNPIQNGQHSDSTQLDVRLMKKRCHVLHNMLQGFVQRKDYTALSKYLCEKLEFIVKVRLTPLQIQLYRLYLDTQTNRGSNPYAVVHGSRDTGLFADYQSLMRIWTHPRVLRLHTVRQSAEKKAVKNRTNVRKVDIHHQYPLLSFQENANFLNDESSEEYEVSSDEEGSGDDKDKNEAPVNGVAPSGSGDEKNNSKQKKRKSHDLSESESSESNSETEEESSFGGSSSENEDENEKEKTNVKRVRMGGRYRLRGGKSDDDESKENETETQQNTEVEDNSWYSSLYKEHTEQFETFDSGGKLAVLFEILYLAQQCDDKVLVFSQSLLSLDLIEEMLQLSTAKVLSLEAENAESNGIHQKWYKNVDYFRIDGSSVSKSRQRWINEFNSEEDRRARLFLISTKAGSLGVNLVAANRVVIFDASWNPSHDVQSIFRVYRFGQTKCCYIYRLIAQGTMEEKIYDRQVTKQSLSFRVVDEQQINRYFTAHDLQELYNFTPSEPPKDGDPAHTLPKDNLLAELLVGNRTKDLIASYHKHDSLLDHQEEEELSEEDRKAAWEEYEREKVGLPPTRPTPPSKPIPASDDLIRSAQLHFYRQQMMAQQQLLKLKREEMLKKQQAAFGPRPEGSIPSRQVVFAQMMQVTEKIAEVKKKIQQTQPLDTEETVAAMRQLPMYANIKEDNLRMMAFEVKLRRQQIHFNAERELKTLQLHMRKLNEDHQQLVSQEESAASKSGANSLIPASSMLASDPVLHKAGLMARTAFADMLKRHGLNQDAASTSVKQNSASSSNYQVLDLTASKPSDQPSSSAAVDLTTAPDQDSNVKPKTLINNNAQLDTAKATVVTRMQPSVSLVKLSNPSSLESLSKKESASESNVMSAEKTDSVPTKPDSLPKAIVKSVARSVPGKKQKKPRKNESSDDDFVLTDEEDDWELTYLKKAKANSRRAWK